MTTAPAHNPPHPMTGPTATARRGFDPYAAAAPASAWRFLTHLNPLAKLAGPLPAMIALVFVRDLATPLVFLAVAYALILLGARLSWRMVLVLIVAIPAFVALLTVGLSVWADTAELPPSPVVVAIGGWQLTVAALGVGLATALRLAAITALALICGLTATGTELTRALVQQLRVPYRIGYTALAAFRFVPRFAYELDVIRAAHRVRGAGHGRGPIAAVRRRTGYVIPLMAGGIRHAERVALAMDARAFGAHPTRTERHLVPFRARDWAFMVGFWVLTGAILCLAPAWG